LNVSVNGYVAAFRPSTGPLAGRPGRTVGGDRNREKLHDTNSGVHVHHRTEYHDKRERASAAGAGGSGVGDFQVDADSAVPASGGYVSRNSDKINAFGTKEVHFSRFQRLLSRFARNGFEHLNFVLITSAGNYDKNVLKLFTNDISSYVTSNVTIIEEEATDENAPHLLVRGNQVIVVE
jgi:hypothetical protein